MAKEQEAEEAKKEETEKKEVKNEQTGEDSEVVVAEEQKHLVTPVEEEEVAKSEPVISFDVEAWKPKTEIGKKVKLGEITDIDAILDGGKKPLEPQIVDLLIPGIESELLLIGQSKGKFGGGQRRVFKQTQKKTKEGNKPSFATFAVVGDRKGHIGLGYGKSRETVPAREKAVRRAKLNLIKIRRGCGSWQCNCKEPHSIPFEVEGKCGSVRITLKPAPKGTGLCAGSEIAKVLKLAGVEDVWSKTTGKTTSRINLTTAITEALTKLMAMKMQEKYKEKLNIAE
jgi:small subunit ribosomal protein S5